MTRNRSWRRTTVRTALLLAPLVVLLIADHVIAPYYRLAYNETSSLPGTLFLVTPGRLPDCGPAHGQPVQLSMPADARWYAGERLLKVAKGCPGDKVRVAGHRVFINDWFAGEAVPALTDGTPMTAITPGVIPDGHYYMWASHPASFDSRYAEFSLVPASRIVGAARRIF